MTDLSMESLFVMGNGSAVNEHIRKEQELSKPNLTSIETNILLRKNKFDNKPQLKKNLNQQLKPNITYFPLYFVSTNPTTKSTNLVVTLL